MQVPFHHPLQTHAAGTVLFYRKARVAQGEDPSKRYPVYPIAGGSGEGEGGSGSGGSEGQGQSGQGADGAAGQGSGQEGQQSGQGSGQSGSGTGDGTDWKAEARKWEDRAKANKGAVDELEKLKAANMSDQEKAVKAAKDEGRTAAIAEAAPQIAQARLEAAAARAGVDLSDFAEYIDVSKFIDQDGAVNDRAIKSAVDKFAKLAPARGAGRSGGDMSGGSGHQAPTLEQQIAQAKADGNVRLVMRLENSKLAAAEANQQ